ncbi:Hypothetical predicted protein [Paramuricea clavata]|uniref:Uncharacterized protein n=1 Tax=Paramuricea clavata TaxID=317549 RepID=A0A6S7JPE9_PARCT|nr:Hypothetical predicted protein [Paramuricea clavata]
MGAICLQAAVLGLFLPETKGTPTLETMDDMKKNQRVALLDVNSNDKVEANNNDTEL